MYYYVSAVILYTWTRVAEGSHTAFDTYNAAEAGGMYQINRHTEPVEHKNLTQFARSLASLPSFVFDDLSDAFRLPGGRR